MRMTRVSETLYLLPLDKSKLGDDLCDTSWFLQLYKTQNTGATFSKDTLMQDVKGFTHK